MAEVKQAPPRAENEVVVDRAKDFWSTNGRIIMIAGAALLILIGGFFAYNSFISGPKEKKATEAIFKAEEYYRMDSLQKALNGDGQFPGFERVISQYGGTEAGNMAKFYAGSIYVKTGDMDKAIKYLKDFSTDADQVQARAYKLLADAYADKGQNSEALSNYKKAATAFEDDAVSSPEYLFMAAYFADKVMNDKTQAIELYKQVKTKFPRSNFAMEASRYLGMAGVYDVD
ncbi:MAG: tetratricopeptide repeat protein [Flavisolibacter sp.]|jgi:predicted negative regulator of RcsB-dependent stress response|nr:tetratricopeptide repeat protein [Flavisolibacter sp.]